jgi:hypothetical protein
MDTNSVWDTISRWEAGEAPDSYNKLIITTSPNIELMLVVTMLAAPTPSPAHYGTLDHPIAQAARTWFTPFIDHPAVELVRRLFYCEDERMSGFACDAVTSFIYRRSNPPALDARYPYSKSVLSLANGDNAVLDLLIEQLRSFYHASHFVSFLAEHRSVYQDIERHIASYVRAGWAGENVIATMENYFGEKHTSFVLVPTPMERPGGGTMDLIGDNNNYIFANFDCTVDKDWILYLIYHEAGHSFVNPLAEKHSDLVRQYDELYAPLKEVMRPWGYVNWTVTLNEHVLRAQNCRLRRLLLGDGAAEAQLNREESQGFQYIRALEAKLAEYEAQRENYPALFDFYPVLMTALDPFLRQTDHSE